MASDKHVQLTCYNCEHEFDRTCPSDYRVGPAGFFPNKRKFDIGTQPPKDGIAVGPKDTDDPAREVDGITCPVCNMMGPHDFETNT